MKRGDRKTAGGSFFFFSKHVNSTIVVVNKMRFNKRKFI